MASLLDEVLGQSDQTPQSLLQIPDERPPSLQPDPRVDALGQTFQAIVDYEKRKHQEGVDAGNWEGGWPWEGGHPTWQAAKGAVDAYAHGLQAGTLKGPGPFTTYQGSPHLFEPTPKNPLGEFSNEKIGTGEGAQAYGMGHYTAENEAVGQGYRKKLSGPRPDYTGEIAPEFKAALNAEDYLGFDTPGQAITAMRTHPDWAERWDVQNPDALRAGLEAHDAAKYGGQGHMYEVKINADPERYLNWDKPLSEQHPDVRAALDDVLRFQKVPLKNNVGTETTGGQMMQYLEARLGKVDAATELSSSGIPGIRYRDAQSRQPLSQIAQSKQAIADRQRQIAELQDDIDRNPNNMLPAFYSRRRAEIAQHQQVIDQIQQEMKEGMSEGTHNYVTFDPAKMEIIRRYGLAGLMLGGGGLLSPDKQEQ